METPTNNSVLSTRRAWIVVAMLIALMMINFMDKAVMGLAAKSIITDFGLTDDEYGLVSSIFFALFFLTALLGGFLSNRVSSRWLLFGMAIVWAVAQLSVVFAGGLFVLVLSRMLLGASEGPTFPIANHASYKWLRESDRSLASSLISGGASFGVLLGAPVLTMLIVGYGWRSAFLASAMVTVAWSIVWLFVGREGPGTERVQAESVEQVAAVAVEGLRTSYLRTFLSGTFLASALSGFAVYWSAALWLAYGPLYLEDILDLSLPQIATFLSIREVFACLFVYVGLGFVVRRLIAKGVSTRIARGILGGACVLISGLATLGFVLLPGGELKLVINVISALGFVTFAISQTVCAEISPVRQRGGVLGAYAAIYALAGVVAPIVTGRLSAALGPVEGLKASWLLMAGLLMASGIAAILFVRPARDGRMLAEHARRRGGDIQRPGASKPNSGPSGERVGAENSVTPGGVTSPIAGTVGGQ
ncbi:MAG: MFS transporter [Rhodococcus sp. (in: high G+C Gram-positive bacteria)]|nr:MAG: MFS transporter [Rhodococcus sp. (in: high G+C Gram-positive bacteria)]